MERFPACHWGLTPFTAFTWGSWGLWGPTLLTGGWGMGGGRAPEEASQSYFLVKCPLKDPRLALSPNQGTGPGHLGPSHPKVPKGLDRSWSPWVSGALPPLRISSNKDRALLFLWKGPQLELLGSNWLYGLYLRIMGPWGGGGRRTPDRQISL